MSYLADIPSFHHVLLLQRDDALWLVPGGGGRWTLPIYVSDEQHTAEVELVARHMRAKYGVRMSILGTVATDFDEAATRVRKAYLAEALTDSIAAGRWWPRTALADGEAPLCGDVEALVSSWVTKSLGLGDTAWSRPVRALDSGRRFLLMEAFAGEPLVTRDVSVWAAAARGFGELQRECIDAVAELQALGCEVTPATVLVEPLSALLDEADALVGEPAWLTVDELATLRALEPRLVADARSLDAGPLPLAVDHGDLWPSNVLVGPGGCAFVDWEDVRIAHPFISPFQLLAGAHLDRRFADEPGAYAAIREAYLAGWSGWAPASLLRQAFDVAHDVAAVAVAASYRRYPAAVVAAHSWMREMPPFCLRRILARRACAEGSVGPGATAR
jgi:hypothetical protein